MDSERSREAREPVDQATGFERALEGLRASGASDTMRELVELLASHGAEEGRILAEYARASSSVSDAAARYLIDLIMEDEQRHHRLLVDLATAIAWEPLDGDDARVPPLGWHVDRELADAARRLREYEEKDRRELKALRKKLRPFEDTTIWALMVQLILLDTEKHATILEFLERHSRHVGDG
jgi:rubrerythrin